MLRLLLLSFFMQKLHIFFANEIPHFCSFSLDKILIYFLIKIVSLPLFLSFLICDFFTDSVDLEFSK